VTLRDQPLIAERKKGKWMNLHEEFEQGVGTYLKVIRFAEWTNPDGFVVLYLRPRSRFLMAGYWSGYERSSAAGQWVGTAWRSSSMEQRGNSRTWCRPIEVPRGPSQGFYRSMISTTHRCWWPPAS
jgi:hypothetical protein